MNATTSSTSESLQITVPAGVVANILTETASDILLCRCKPNNRGNLCIRRETTISAATAFVKRSEQQL